MRCDVCQNEMRFLQGISKKTNKPYKMWKCQCDKVQFVNDEPRDASEGYNRQPNPPATPKRDPEGERVKSFAMAYAKDLVVAMIAAGEKVSPATKTIHIFRPIYRELTNPFSEKTVKDEKQISEINDFSQDAI